MKRRRQRKCLCCGSLFRPDPRNVRHQRYCSKPACRKASKAARQRRWLAKPENQDYFRGPEHVARVQAWRSTHPGYWRRPGIKAAVALQDDSCTQAFELSNASTTFAGDALQDVLSAQPAVLIGLIAHVTASALQDDIARSARRLLQLGQDILGGRVGGVAIKRVICPERLRKIPAQFSWVDHRLVRDRHLERCDVYAAALYLFLVTVADAQGLSYYSDASLARVLSMDLHRLSEARGDLIRVGLIAYERPLYQVLALDSSAPREASGAGDEVRARLSQLRAALGKRHDRL